MKGYLAAASVLVIAVSLLTAQEAGDTRSLIERIQKVGREGKGNVEAAKAWKLLVAQGPTAIEPILTAMRDDDLTVVNWLRPAFEAIAESALEQNQLSAEPLEKIVTNTKNAGIARRAAYEWLVKLDDSTPSRLLPGMLLDPSPDLRREAVNRFIDQAAKATDKKEAQELYRKALTGAADPEQVEKIADALGKLGDKVDLAKHFGVISDWYLVTPFDHRDGIGWNKAYPPEQRVDVTATYVGKNGKQASWLAHKTSDPRGLVDLNKIFGPLKGTIAYACAFIESPETRVAYLRVSSINGLKVFLNGKEVFAREEYHHGMPIDQYTIRVTLNQGVNTLLLKVCQNEQTEKWAQEWKFQARLCDFVGSAVPFKTVPAPKGGK